MGPIKYNQQQLRAHGATKAAPQRPKVVRSWCLPARCELNVVDVVLPGRCAPEGAEQSACEPRSLKVNKNMWCGFHLQSRKRAILAPSRSEERKQNPFVIFHQLFHVSVPHAPHLKKLELWNDSIYNNPKNGE